jgi:hypothetical protein
MGCWNETCGITQMPICAGDPVRMFLIVENKYGDTGPALSYNSEIWKPFGLPIKGTYDEYGRIENIEEDALSDFLLETIKEMVIEVPNRMGDVFKREELTWETVIDFLTDEGLKVTNPFDVELIGKRLDAILAKVKELVPNLPDNGWSSERSDLAKQQKKEVEGIRSVSTMYHMMVHEDVYQALARKYKAPEERFSSWTNGNLRAKLEVDAKAYIVDARKQVEQTKGMSDIDLVKFKWELRDLRGFSSNRFVSATNHLNGNYNSGEYLRKYLDFVEKRISEGASDDDPQIQELTNQFIDFCCFNQCMVLLRKQWEPQCGKGGQDREFVLHKFLGETIVAFSEKKIKEWDEEYGEDIEDADSEEEDEDAEEGE